MEQNEVCNTKHLLFFQMLKWKTEIALKISFVIKNKLAYLLNKNEIFTSCMMYSSTDGNKHATFNYYWHGIKSLFGKILFTLMTDIKKKK